MIDDRAVIEPGAKLGKDVAIGPFSIVGAGVSIGDGTWIGPHVVINGETSIGALNKIYQFSSIGDAPQHLGYSGEPTRLEIGNRNVIREYCTINRGTEEGGGVTRIGDDNFLMAYVHIAHDCSVGNRTIFANCASLAGHVEVGDYAVLGGFSLVHQFCRIGAHCITGIGAVCLQDVPPYVIAAGNRAIPHGVNIKGLRRRDFTKTDISELKKAYRVLYRSGHGLKEALCFLDSKDWTSLEVQRLANFIKHTRRGIIR
ncbi:MAG: acyl-ACP--UDP-N-acetylglucosamine O-acyltransferase [Gammaproteobacteria bacterium]|nr:acyl-ACP--UDP-N-acetylglucosamine O-acyltransferase [Gammaproteobacteria bacterium]